MSTTAEKLAYLVDTKAAIKAAIESKGVTVEDSTTFREYADKITTIVGTEEAQTYILIDDAGNEYTAVLVEDATVFDATENDFREGKVAATASGVTTGTKVIPSYNTSEGFKVITAGSRCEITLSNYEYTKLQAIFCVYNTSSSDSVAADKISINDKVYAVNSTEELSTVTIDIENKSIDFGLVNDSDKRCILRYFTYKEIY